MTIRILSLAAAAALALSAFAGSPAAAAAIAPTASPANITADAGSLVSPVQYGERRHRYHRRHHFPRRHHFSHRPFFPQAYFHFPRHHAPCWTVRHVWTPWGYEARRIWVCGRW